MLVLTRKIGELVRIGDDVTVRVLGIRSGQVSLGFVAPTAIKIFREEVLRMIESGNRRAALDGRDPLHAAADLWEAYGLGKER